MLDDGETTIADIVAATHHTAAIGKWHIGPDGDADHPIDLGFEYYAGPLGNVDDYRDWDKATAATGMAGTIDTGITTYVTTDNADEAVAKIAEFGDDPWFVWVAFTAPHAPFHVPPDALTTVAVNDASNNRTKYEAAVEAMDSEIARILASIDADVLADTTIVFFGDNGSPPGVTRPPFDSDHAKDTMYEGGINVPMIVVSPRIDPADRGSESLALVQSVDLFATVAEIAGVDAHAEDSISLVPYLEDPTLPTQQARRYAYAEAFAPNGSGPYTEHRRGVTDDRYKLIWRDGVYEEFFDLFANPFEDAGLPDGVPAALAGANAVTVQLRGSDAAVCLSATLTDVSKQDDERFQARE